MATLLNVKDLQGLRDAFYAIDQDLDGGITAEDLTKAYESSGLLDEETDEDALQDIFNKMDDDNDGEIHFWEFISGTLDPNLHFSHKNLYQTFKFFDTDDANCITFKSLKESFRRGGRVVSDEEIESMYSELGMSVHEKISFGRFLEIVGAYQGSGDEEYGIKTQPNSITSSCDRE